MRRWFSARNSCLAVPSACVASSVKRLSTARSGAIVQELKSRIDSQNRSGLPLLAAIDNCLNLNQDKLIRLYDLDVERVQAHGLLGELEAALLPEEKIKRKRLQLLESNNKAHTPRSLLLQLYPLHDLRQFHVNFTSQEDSQAQPTVSFPKIFAQFKKLSSPFHMDPPHFNFMVDKFMFGMNFKRPKASLGGFNHKSAVIVRAHKNQVRERRLMMQKIDYLVSEMHRNRIPLTSVEKATVVAYTLFRDKPSIRALVEEAYREKKLVLKQDPPFDYGTYRKFDPDIQDSASLNVFLDLAIRHEAHDVVRYIRKRRTDLHDRQTAITVLNYISGAPRGLRDPMKEFEDTVASWLQSKLVLDIGVVNAIAKGYCRFSKMDAARELLRPVDVSLGDPTYRGLTAGSKRAYDKALNFYDELKTVIEPLGIEIASPTVAANIETFTPFLEAYSAVGDYHSLIEIINEIRTHNLPVTTKAFRVIWNQIARDSSEWHLDQLIDLTAMLTQDFQTNYNFDKDITKDNLPLLDIPTSLKEFMKGDDRPAASPHPERGNFTKIPDDLVECIVRSYTQKLADDEAKEIATAYKELQDDLGVLRASNPTSDLFTINEATYLKQAFLTDLTEKVYTFIE